MSNGLTLAQKQELYKAGKYKFEAPPVCTSLWDDADWIVYISACDGWLP